MHDKITNFERYCSIEKEFFTHKTMVKYTQNHNCLRIQPSRNSWNWLPSLIFTRWRYINIGTAFSEKKYIFSLSICHSMKYYYINKNKSEIVCTYIICNLIRSNYHSFNTSATFEYCTLLFTTIFYINYFTKYNDWWC